MPHGARRCQMHVRTNEVVNIADATAAQRSLTAARAALEIALWVSTIAAWWCAVYLTADRGPVRVYSGGRVVSCVERLRVRQRRLGAHPITSRSSMQMGEFHDAAVCCRYGATNGAVTSRWFQALNLAGRVNFQRTAALLAHTSPLLLSVLVRVRRATLYQRLSLNFTKYRTDSLWSQSKALLKDGSRPPLPHQPPSCLCTACTTRFQQHPPTACHTPLNKNSSACCFRTTTRPRNSPNLSCRIARPLWSVPSRNSLTEGLALPQASASRPSSRLNALQTNHNHHF